MVLPLRARLIPVIAIVLALSILLSMPLFAQNLDQRYRTPPLDIAEIVAAEPTPAVSVDSNKRWMLLMSRPGLPSIAELSVPELRLAGIRINPVNDNRSRSPYFTGLTVQDLDSGISRQIAGLPEQAVIRHVNWSPDGDRLAFTVDSGASLELWMADVATASARRLLDVAVNAVFATPYSWLADSERLLVKTIPVGRDDAPRRAAVPSGPIIQESSGRAAAARTYQDLLVDSHDEELFDHHTRVQLLLVNLTGEARTLGEPDLLRRVSVSPDANYLLVELIERPFSYLVPHYRFPHRLEVWDLDGRLIRSVAEVPLAEEVPIGRGAVPEGPRAMDWRADAPATLYWVEAQDGGDPRATATVRDVVFTLAAPFSGEAEELISLGLRYSGITWGSDKTALVNEIWWRSRQTRTWHVAPDGSGQPALLFDRSSEDRYSDLGRPVLARNDAGRSILEFADATSIFMAGAGASPEGDRPFLDKLDLVNGSRERLWRSAAPSYASFEGFLDSAQQTMLLRRESPTQPGNYYRLSINDGDEQELTRFPHPYPHMLDIYKEVVRYRRSDGVMLTATLYLPPGKSKQDGPFPMLMWAYPREYKDADSAGQMRGSLYRFNAIGVNGPLPFLASGYAIFDGPTMPIVGEGNLEPNDAYVEQLVTSAAAAVDTVVEMGVAERDRIAIGGHSYGAFMTANLLAHSDLFVAGLARSGAYNRTLTPFGFQAEERTFWEAPDVYFRMSPFMHAQQVEEPILMIHGEADNNSGTFPLQSRRFYNALKGHGVKTRLVMLPHESHGYRARESVLHTLWEMNSWLNRYLMGE